MLHCVIESLASLSICHILMRMFINVIFVHTKCACIVTQTCSVSIGSPGGVSQRCVLNVCPGGASWRCMMEVCPGGVSWKCPGGV